MAGFVALSTNNDVYIGTFKNGEDKGVENGQFVTVNYATGVATLADATTGDKEVYFVANEIDTIPEQGIDDADYVIKKDEFLRLNPPQAGTVYVTTKFNGTLAVGDKVAVGVNGNVEAIGSRTPKTVFVIKEKTTEYGKDAVRLLTL